MGRAASFEVTYGGRLLFSKLARGRFPAVDDVVKPLGELLKREGSAGAAAPTTGTTLAP